MPMTSKAFQPITEIPLKMQDMTRLSTLVFSRAMKNTHTPEMTILAAGDKCRYTLVYYTHLKEIGTVSNFISAYKECYLTMV